MSVSPITPETQRELQEALNHAKPVSDKETITQLKKLEAEVSTPAANKALIDEINDLSGYALSIDTSFYNIEVIFNSIKTSGTSVSLQNDVSALNTTWKTYRQNYIDLLWKSREVAGKAQAAADDFAKDFIGFLSDDEVSLTEKKKEIVNYIAKLDRDEKASQDMSQGFSNLQKNIGTFQSDWKKVVEKHDMKTLAKDIAQLDSDINILEGTLADLEKKIKDLAIATGVLAASAGITFALGFICPAFWIGTLFSVIGVAVTATLLSKAMTERDQCQRDINSKKAQRAEKAADLEAVKQLQAGLTKSEGDFVSIIEKLGAFAGVWATIRADIQAIEEKLDYTHSTESKTLFKTRLNTAAKLYETLGKALRQYQVVVNGENPIFKNKKPKA